MNNKVIFILIFIGILSAGTASMIFLVQKQSQTVLEPAASQPTLLKEKPEEPLTQPEEENTQASMLVTDYFTLILPAAWEEASEVNSLPITLVDSQEEITSEKAKEVHFRTNLSINRAQLEKVSPKDYIESVKSSLISNIPIMEITKEEKTTVNNSEVYFLEIESIQQDLKFNTLVVFVVGNGNTIWALSFNTLAESWPSYKEVFYQMVNNFKIK